MAKNVGKHTIGEGIKIIKSSGIERFAADLFGGSENTSAATDKAGRTVDDDLVAKGIFEMERMVGFGT